MQGKESMLRKNDYRYRSDTSRFVIFLYLLDKRHAIENDRLLARRGEKRKKTVILRLGLTRGDVIPVVPAGWTTSTGSSMRGCPRFMESSTRIIGGNVGTSCWTPTRICRPNCRACTRLGKRGKEPRRKGNLAKTATRYPSWRENHGRWAFYYYYYLSIFYIFLSSKLFLCGNFQSSDHQQFFLYVGTLNSIYSSTNDFHDWESYVKSWISNEIFLSMEKKKVVGRKI